MEDLHQICEEFVLGREESNAPKRISQGIKDGHTSLLYLVETLGIFLTSTNEDSRTRGTGLLSAVLHRLRSYPFGKNEIEYLVTFYCDRLKDRVTVLPQVLYGLQALVMFSGFSDECALQITQALFKELHVQAHPQAERHIVYTVISQFLIHHTEALKSLNNDFVFGYIRIMDGEKDPRNLSIVFPSVLMIIRHLPIDLFVEDLFEVTACYFPIDFTPPPNDPHGVSREDLILSLRNVLASTPKFAEFCLPLLLEKLLSDVNSAKLDSLQTLAACAPVYGGSALKPYTEPLWYSIRRVVYGGTEGDGVMEAALQALQAVGRAMGSEVNKPDSPDLLREFIEIVSKDCLRHLHEPELQLARPAAKALLSIAGATDPALCRVLEAMVPILVQQFNSKLGEGQRVTIMEVLVAMLGTAGVSFTADDDEEGAEIPPPLKAHKDDVLSITLASLYDTSPGVRTAGVHAVVAILKIKRILKHDEVVLCGQRLTALSLQDREDSVRRESAHALAALCKTCPDVAVETVWPLIMSNIGQEDGEDMETEAVQNPSVHSKSHKLSQRDIPAVRLLATISVHADICRVTLSTLLNYLGHLALTGESLSLPEGEESLEISQEIASQFAQAVESNQENLAVMKFFGAELLSRVLRMCVCHALRANDGDANKVSGCLGDKCVLHHLSSSVRVYSQQSDAGGLVKRIVHLFVHGDLSLLGEDEGQTQPCFKPLAVASAPRQTQLVVFLKDFVGSQTWESISEHASVLLPLLRDLALAQTMSSSTAESAAKTYSAIINKCPDSESLCATVTSDLELAWTKIRDGSPEEKQRAVTTILWVCKGLVVRSHPLGQKTVVKLLQHFTDPVVGQSAADQFAILLRDEPDVLTHQCRAVVKLMHKQQFFVEVVPVIATFFDSAQGEAKPCYLRAISHILRQVPRQVLLGALPKLFPILIQSLDSSEVELKVSTLEGLTVVTQDAPSVITSHVPTLIPKLLELAKCPDTMRIRIPALKCINSMLHLPSEVVFPHRPTVIKGLAPCLDDKKRLVRREAAKARSDWFLLGAL